MIVEHKIISSCGLLSLQATKNVNTNRFTIIAADVAEPDESTTIVKDEVPEYFDNYDYTDPNIFGRMELVPVEHEKIGVGNSHVRSSGVKRAKFADEIVQETMARLDCGVTKDQYSVFGDFVTNELRELGVAKFRRAKLAIQKCLLDLAEEEA